MRFIYEYLSRPIVHDQTVIEGMLKEFIFHVDGHFSNEERMMRETDCPIINCHEGEHKRVQFLKDYFECEFKPWIENHIFTMDTVTGMFLKKMSEQSQ